MNIIDNMNFKDYDQFGKVLLAEEVIVHYKAGKKLNGVKIMGQNLGGADLRGISLEGSTIFKTNFVGANLSNANLSGVVFNECDLNGANLRNADLSAARLENVICDNGNFSGANLSDTVVKSELCLTKNPSEFRIPPEIEEMMKKNPAEIDISSFDLELEDIGVSVSDFKPGKCSMAGTDFSQALFTNTDFDKVSLDAVIFTGADLKRSLFNMLIELAPQR